VKRLHALFGNIDQQEHIRYDVIDYLSKNSYLDLNEEYSLAEQFLQSYSASPDTYKSYRREIERLLQWCWFEAKCRLYDMDRCLFEEYLKFAFNPPREHIATKSVPRFIDIDGSLKANSSWRPYLQRPTKLQKSLNLSIDNNEYVMNPSARKALFAGVSTFCTYLLQEDYLQKNPVALIRQKSRYITRSQTERVTRKLTDLQWLNVIKAIDLKCIDDSKYERHYFLISIFYLLGVRISEVSSSTLHDPIMGDFYRDNEGLWWFKVIGKGNKLREIAVPDEMLNSLKRYRVYLNMPPLPIRDEQTPLLNNLKTNNGLSTRQVRTIIQECFDLAANSLLSQGFDDQAHDLMAATVHWLRHTAISADVKHRPQDHVRDDAGHESISTTNRYIDIDRVDRHRSAQGKNLFPNMPKER
jgi:site-specific recombinase XerD